MSAVLVNAQFYSHVRDDADSATGRIINIPADKLSAENVSVVALTQANFARAEWITAVLNHAAPLLRLFILLLMLIGVFYYSLAAIIVAAFAAVQCANDGFGIITAIMRHYNGGLDIRYDGCKFYVSAHRPAIVIGRGLIAQHHYSMTQHRQLSIFIIVPFSI